VGWLDLAFDFAGSILGAVVYAAFCVAAIYAQYHEYRRAWKHGTAAWWTIKLATPCSVALVVGLALLLFDTEGMEGLAVFYLGILAALLLSPVLIGGFTRLFGIPAADALKAAASLILSLLVLWFAGAGVLNSLSGLPAGDLEAKAEYRAFRHAAESAPAASGQVELAASDVWLLPDGARLIHLAFDIEPGYQIYTIDVRTLRTHPGGNSDSFNGTLGSCVTADTYHMTTVLHDSEFFDVSLRFHAGTPASMVEFRGDYRFPKADAVSAGPLVLEYRDNTLLTPVPLPGYFLSLYFADGSELTVRDLLPEEQERTAGMYPGNQCFTGGLPGVYKLRRVEATLYSEEQSRKLRFELPLRRQGYGAG